MNNITYAVSVDVNNPIIPYNVYVASVLDSNVRYLEITLYQNGNVIVLSNEATATASLVTDNVLVDGNVNCTISDNIITVPLEDLQRHGNLDVQVTVTEGTKVLAIPFPIQVRVTPDIAENAQIDENSLGSYAEVVHEIAEARGTHTTLHDAIAAKLSATPGAVGTENLADESVTVEKVADDLAAVINAKEEKSNKKTTLTGNESSNDFYPTTKAVADALSTKAPASTAYTFDATTTNVVYNANNPKKIYTRAIVNGKNAFVLTTSDNYYQLALCCDGTEYKRELTSSGAVTYTAWAVVNNESSSNKQSSITDANKASTVRYPSIKAVVDYLAANYENLSNKLTSEAGIDGDSTDTEYPTAKAVFNFGADILDEVAGDLVLKENLSNKKTTITGYETSNQFYPTIKAVADALNTKVSRLDIPSTINLLKGNGSGGISVANPGSDYQPPLVSGTNIKTINNISILGSGNINIEGSGGSSDLIVSDSIGDNALEFVDEQGHVVMLVDNTGAIRTKTFNSSSATNTPSQLTDMVYEVHRRTAANTEFPVFSIKGNVLVIGDSTVAGTNVGTKISALMSIASGCTLTDISQGGDTIQGQTGKYNNLSSSVKAAINYAVIQIGLNDVYPASANLNDLKVKYRTLIDTIKANSPNAYIVISCMLPCRARWQALVPSTADHAQQMWAGLNQSIIDNEYGADAVASIHQWALAYNDFVLRPEYDTGDKIHENKAGQQVILLSWLSAMFNNNSLSKGGNS